MRRAIVVAVTLAILGSLSVYARDQQNKPAAVTPAQTTSNPISAPNTTSNQSGSYKDGTFTGTTAETPYGSVQVAVVINSGKISEINFLQMPSDLRHSEEVTAMSEPLLKQETLTAQSATIDFVSGATSTSFGYQESLQAALDQAKLS